MSEGFDHLRSAEQAISDVEDVLLVVGSILNASQDALSDHLRDALATVVRMGKDRAEEARGDLAVLTGGARG